MSSNETMEQARCYQINLQRGCGGGEVYTGFFSRALAACNIETTLFAHPGAGFWDARLPAAARIERVATAAEVAARMQAVEPAWIVCHAPLTGALAKALRAQGHRLCCFAHMPLYGRNPEPLAACETIFPVSAYVLDSLLAHGLEQAYREPLLGVADLSLRGAAGAIRQASPYDWDRRKYRDRLLGWLEPLAEPFRSRPAFQRRPGVTLGIVSRLTPIKQFPLLFEVLAPVLARHPHVRLEIFGAGGYASVRALRRALGPVLEQTRFWGHQADVSAAYRQLDYLLTGLPEKEALGLNVIEAQACGTPVLAVAAPPFTETVVDEVSGLFYPDPRSDHGVGFGRRIERLEAAPFRIDAAAAAGHLARFGEAAFVERVGRLVAWCRRHGMLAASI